MTADAPTDQTPPEDGEVANVGQEQENVGDVSEREEGSGREFVMDPTIRRAFRAARRHAYTRGNVQVAHQLNRYLRANRYPQSFDLAQLEYGDFEAMATGTIKPATTASYATNHPPFNGPKSGRDAWRRWAYDATDWEHAVIDSLGRDALITALRAAGVIAPA